MEKLKSALDPLDEDFTPIQRERIRALIKAEVISTAYDSLSLNPLHVEPTKRRPGRLAYADGTDWDPGSGEGLYIYTSAGWSLL